MTVGTFPIHTSVSTAANISESSPGAVRNEAGAVTVWGLPVENQAVWSVTRLKNGWMTRKKENSGGRFYECDRRNYHL